MSRAAPLRESGSMYGAGSEDALAFHLTVYHLTEQIPAGRVSTYGHLAYLAGKPAAPRQAGRALKYLARAPTARYNTECVPWWRVISASGRISNVEHRDEQRQRLDAEIGAHAAGDAYDLHEYGWFPEPDEVDLDFDAVDASGAGLPVDPALQSG